MIECSKFKILLKVTKKTPFALGQKTIKIKDNREGEQNTFH